MIGCPMDGISLGKRGWEGGGWGWVWSNAGGGMVLYN
jgi:hypothetical protein